MQDERLDFIQEALAAEDSLAAVCRRYGVSRKTGYKWLERYQAEGVGGLADRSRAPKSRPAAIAEAVEEAVVALRARRPSWGERKLKAWLERERPGEGWPSAAAIGAILKRRGLTVPPKRRRRATPSEQLTRAERPNQVWSIDFKGWFRTADGRRCDPLTICDADSRYLLRCQVVPRCSEAHVKPLLEATFRTYGMPEVIRSDNGPPFASTGLAGLSRLSVWWLKLGIRPDRIQPGHPEQNGRHERLHRTLKRETATPPKASVAAQQRAFDRFRRDYNEERPHEALSMETPASLYKPSCRPFPERLPELEYPPGWALRRVAMHGDIGFRNQSLFLTETLAGEVVAIEEVEPGWKIWFGDLPLGLLDRKQLERKGSRRHRPRLRPS